MFIYKIIFLEFFDLKLPKRDTFEAINEESFVRLLTCSSMFLYNQSELTIFAKCFVKTAGPLLLKCNLILCREEPFMLLLPTKRTPFPFHRFSSFLLSSLIWSSRSWSSRWMTLDKTISILPLTSFSLSAFITFLIFSKVLTLFVRSLVPEWTTIIFGFFRAVCLT